MTQALTTFDKLRYRKLKQIVTDNWQSTLKAYEAIKELKEKKLYLSEFDTWDHFCEVVLKFTPQHVNRLISAFDVSEALLIDKQLGGKSEPTGSLLVNERQARELAKVPPQQRAAVVAKAAATGPVTAVAIAKAAQPVIELDKTGYAIPKPILPLWQRAESESRDALALVAKLKSALKEASEQNDIIYRPLDFQENMALLTRLRDNLKLVMPYAVCTLCQGALPARCGFCRGRGFISEFSFKTHVDEKTKAIRAKGSA